MTPDLRWSAGHDECFGGGPPHPKQRKVNATDREDLHDPQTFAKSRPSVRNRCLAATLVAGPSCGSKEKGAPAPGGSRPDAPSTPGTEVTVSVPAAQQAALTTVQGQLSGSESLDAATLVAQHALPFATTLGYDPSSSIPPSPTYVHTQPDNEAGERVGRVLHVGTGYPRLMGLTVESCGGPRAYVGLASAYLEVVTEKFKRLTDDEWRMRLEETNRPGPVPRLRDVVSER